MLKGILEQIDKVLKVNSLCSQLESGVENDERGPCREVVALLILIDLAKTKRLQAASTAPKPRTEFGTIQILTKMNF